MNWSRSCGKPLRANERWRLATSSENRVDALSRDDGRSYFQTHSQSHVAHQHVARFDWISLGVGKKEKLGDDLYAEIHM